ncbi:MAG TPA: hypothetical protein VIK53_07035 [Verrucomicrobiae bacterium]
MNQVQHTTTGAGGAGGAVHLLVTEGDVRVMAEDPEQVMEEIELRATSVGPVLEAIFRESGNQSRWGINE